MSSSQSTFIYEAKVGALAQVVFWKNPEDNSYNFTFFNGVDYTPLKLSEDAAYYVWTFLGCEHPDAIMQQEVARIFQTKLSSSSKKAGRCKTTKRPSLKKKAKSK